MLESLELIGNVSGSTSYDLESFTTLTADMQVRFRIVQGLDGTTQHINFDIVDIAYSGPGIGGAASVSVATASSRPKSRANRLRTIFPFPSRNAENLEASFVPKAAGSGGTT